MSKELYKVLRPKTLDGLYGQDTAVKQLRKMMAEDNVPHSVVLSGPSGCGKTTIARILRRHLKVGDFDFHEMNAATDNGVDVVRKIKARMNMAATKKGGCRMYLLDEAHMLTTQAQNALLKMLEDTPDHVYFVLCTTDPQKLVKAVQSRCTTVKVQPLVYGTMLKMLEDTVKLLKKGVSRKVLGRIAEVADGGARKAMVILQQVIGQESEDDQLACVLKSDVKTAAFELVKVMMPWNPRQKTAWDDVRKILEQVEGEDPEGLRRLVLAVARSQLLKGGPLAYRAHFIISVFRDNVFDSGNAGLAANCWEVCTTER